MYDAGSLRWQGDFYKPADADPIDNQDTRGRTQNSPAPAFSTRIGMRDLTGHEVMVAEQVNANVRTLMWARWRDGVQATWQVRVKRNRTTWIYEIAEPPRDPDNGLRVWMEFFVVRLEVPAGS